MDLGKFGPALKREPDQRIVAVQAELLTDAIAMVLDRAVTDEQLLGNRLTGLALSDEFQDVQFGWREFLQPGCLLYESRSMGSPIHQIVGDHRADIVLARGDRADAADNVTAGA